MNSYFFAKFVFALLINKCIKIFWEPAEHCRLNKGAV